LGKRAAGKRRAAAIANRPVPAPTSTTRAGSPESLVSSPAQPTIAFTIACGVSVTPRNRRAAGGLIEL
jgi:hypothetical protein